MQNAKKRKPGRPRKYKNPAEKLHHYRKRQDRRLDLYVSSQASWRLSALAKDWNVSKSKAVERLLMETDSRYQNILFPET